MWTGARELRDFLDRSARRLLWIAAAEGTAAGLLVAAAAPLFGVPTGPFSRRVGVALVLAVLGAALRIAITGRRRRRIAFEIERSAPGSRNVIITASELLERTDRVPAYIGERVTAEAAAIAGTLDPARLFAARNALIALTACVLLWSVSVTRARARVAPPTPTGARVVGETGIAGIEAEVVPPGYSGLPATTHMDPARITVLAGSRIRLAVDARAGAVTVTTRTGTQSLALRNGAFRGEVEPDGDGFITIEAASRAGAEVRHLIGVTVTADLPPRVRITEPAGDLFLPDAERTLDVVIEADDDIALSTLAVRYTKVSGSGEQFTFTDGELPLTIDRAGGRTWTGRTRLRLDTLGLGPGDVLVYRGVASDGRPGAEPAESDAFLIEITAPGSVAMGGFAIDDEQDRYAISQQMVILQTQRLIARAAGLPPDSLERNALSLAAQQRTVRAEFVFMMGGELAEEIEQADAGIGDLNEEAHTEADDEAIAGRLENRSRFALIRAIRSMSRAYDALAGMRLDEALIEERAALDQLQDAFTRTRYILRALTEREQLDLSRRLTGDMDEASGDTRPAAAANPAELLVVLRDVLAGIAAIAGNAKPGPAAASRAVSLAETVLRSDASDTGLQDIATRLGEAGRAIEEGRAGDARALLNRAAAALTQTISGLLPDAPVSAPAIDIDRLDGARTDALRGGGGR